MAARRPDLVERDIVRAIRVVPAADSTETIYRFAFNADESLKRSIDRLKEVLSNKHPTGRLEDILSEAIDDYLERNDPLRREPAQRRETRNPDARRVPPAIRDEVWRRDAGRCAFAGEGRRCRETKWLELDHVIPWALGGKSDDARNIRLLCRAHNQWEAETWFGPRR
jgi:hypothetical protein